MLSHLREYLLQLPTEQAEKYTTEPSFTLEGDILQSHLLLKYDFWLKYKTQGVIGSSAYNAIKQHTKETPFYCFQPQNNPPKTLTLAIHPFNTGTVKETLSHLDNNPNIKNLERKTLSTYLQGQTHRTTRVYQVSPTHIVILTTREKLAETERHILKIFPALFPTIEVLDNYTQSLNSLNPEQTATQLQDLLQETLQLLNERSKNTIINNLIHNILPNLSETMYNPEITNTQRNITMTEQNLKIYYDKLRNLQLQAFNTISEEEKTTLDKFLTNNNEIKQIKIRDNKCLILEILTPATFQPEYAEAILRKITIPTMAKIFKAIFIEQKAILYLQNCVSIDLSQKTLNTLDSQFTETIPNPHLIYFNCWGGNTSAIQKALVNKQYTAALAQIIAAVGNINFLDGPVVDKFIRYLWSPNKCMLIKYPNDPTCYNIQSFLEKEKKTDGSETEPNR